MSEPKTVAASTTEIVPGLHHFKIDDERIRSQSDAYAVVVDGRVLLIDPIPLDPAQLGRLGRVEAIVIGSPSHQRCAWRYRREHGVKVYAPEGWADLDEKPDVTYRAGDPLPLGLKALHAPGPAKAHHVFHYDRGPGVLLCTDLWHIGSKGLEFLPDKYMNDAALARESGRRLLEVDFDVLCLGHGEPIRSGARKVLAELIRKDAESRKGNA